MFSTYNNQSFTSAPVFLSSDYCNVLKLKVILIVFLCIVQKVEESITKEVAFLFTLSLLLLVFLFLIQPIVYPCNYTLSDNFFVCCHDVKIWLSQKVIKYSFKIKFIYILIQYN